MQVHSLRISDSPSHLTLTLSHCHNLTPSCCLTVTTLHTLSHCHTVTPSLCSLMLLQVGLQSGEQCSVPTERSLQGELHGLLGQDQRGAVVHGTGGPALHGRTTTTSWSLAHWHTYTHTCTHQYSYSTTGTYSVCLHTCTHQYSYSTTGTYSVCLHTCTHTSTATVPLVRTVCAYTRAHTPVQLQYHWYVQCVPIYTPYIYVQTYQHTITPTPSPHHHTHAISTF